MFRFEPQRSTGGFLAELILRITRMKYINIQKCLQLMSMEGLVNDKQLICTNYDFVSEVNPFRCVTIQKDSKMSPIGVNDHDLCTNDKSKVVPLH